MEITKEQIKNSVLEVIFRSDQYIDANEVSLQTGIENDEFIEALNGIKSYNELFLDIYKYSSKDHFLNVRVPEFMRDEVRTFLDNGGFVSLNQNPPAEDLPEVIVPVLPAVELKEKQSKEKNTKNFLKAAGLIALLTLTVKKSFTFFRK